MYSFSVKVPANKKKMELVHSITASVESVSSVASVVLPLEPSEVKLDNNKSNIAPPPFTPLHIESAQSASPQSLITAKKVGALDAQRCNKMGPALFTLCSTSKDIEYPTSNSILKNDESKTESKVFTSEVYESCVLSFSIVEIMENISVGLNNSEEKYYGIQFKKGKCAIITPSNMKSDLYFDYEIGDTFKIILLLNEINIFKNECKIYTTPKKTNENDSYRALFTLHNKEDEIRNIQFYYIHHTISSFIKQGPTIILTGKISKDIKLLEDDTFYLLEGVSSIISGISKGKNGQRIIIINNSDNIQTFSDDDATSLPENRLYLGVNNIKIKNKSSIQFLYVSNLGKWVFI